ncbi:MAG: adenylyltransferase/cytidyltransferase family protein, partial [Spirochaetia bacterium]
MSNLRGDQDIVQKATRTAIFGGTFDPVHLGHLFAAEEVLDRFDYERVVFVPARIAPHKDEAPAVSPTA